MTELMDVGKIVDKEIMVEVEEDKGMDMAMDITSFLALTRAQVQFEYSIYCLVVL
jgi:hypothetical protein